MTHPSSFILHPFGKPGSDYRTRIWLGTLMAALTAAMLVADQWRGFGEYHPFLLLFLVVLGPLSCLEMLTLLGPQRRPRTWLCLGSVLLVLVGNWPAHLYSAGDVWQTLFALFAATVLAAFVVEMATYRTPGGSVTRIAVTVWTVAYLGVLPSFLAQLRWLKTEENAAYGVTAIALAIFVPKVCDIGAYFTGRLVGRTPMTPVLSPKKTWEGLAGGLTLATLFTVGLNALYPVFSNIGWAVAFGLTVAIAGVVGDLAESLVKRDCGQKDASQVLPAFGGVLDVVDSILFAAPVAYLWLR